MRVAVDPSLLTRLQAELRRRGIDMLLRAGNTVTLEISKIGRLTVDVIG